MDNEIMSLAESLENILNAARRLESLRIQATHQIGEYHKIDDDLIFAYVPSEAGNIKLNLDMGHWELQYTIGGRGAYCCTLRNVDGKKNLDLRDWKVMQTWCTPFNVIAIIRLKK